MLYCGSMIPILCCCQYVGQRNGVAHRSVLSSISTLASHRLRLTSKWGSHTVRTVRTGSPRRSDSESGLFGRASRMGERCGNCRVGVEVEWLRGEGATDL